MTRTLSKITPPQHVIFLHQDTFQYLHSEEYRSGYEWIYGNREGSVDQRDFLDECLMRIPSVLSIRKNLNLENLEKGEEAPEGFQQHLFLPECLYKPVTRNDELFENWISALKPFYVVIDDKCAESVMRGSDIFSVGVIATNIPKTQRMEKEEVSVIMMKLREGVTLPYGEDAWDPDAPKRVLKGRNMPATYEELESIYADYYHMSFIANGVVQLPRGHIFQGEFKFDIPAVRITESLFNGVQQLHSFNDEHFFAQNVASMLVARAMNVQPSHRVCEACCAPGGKLSHIAHLMNNQGEIVAFERSRKRMDVVQALLAQQHITNTKLIVKDFSQCIKRKLAQPQSFDRILCDLPCTGLGNLNLFFPTSMNQVQEQASYQQKLLEIALQLLKVGGELVFSTCSLFPQENEMNVRHALEKFSGALELIDLHEDMEHLFGEEQWIYNKSKPAYGHSGILENNLHKRVIRFDPCLHEESIGFFMARFKKTAEF